MDDVQQVGYRKIEKAEEKARTMCETEDRLAVSRFGSVSIQPPNSRASNFRPDKGERMVKSRVV